MFQVPEGNGSGVIWDNSGHIVTNYHGKELLFYLFCHDHFLYQEWDYYHYCDDDHYCRDAVVGSALSRNPKLGEIVARVNILASQG